MRVLVCGGRNFDRSDALNWLNAFGVQDASEALGRYRAKLSAVIHGGASGADMAGAEWGKSERVPVIEYKANWRKYGKLAGPIRNQRMATEGKPDVVIAFPGGRGTASMVAIAEANDIPVVRVSPPRQASSSPNNKED